MELTTKTAVDVRASAVLQPDGSVALRVTAHAEYADGMHTSVSMDTADVDPKGTVAAAIKPHLEALARDVEKAIGRRIEHAIHESRRVGRAEGELDENFEPVPAEERDEE